MIEALVVLLIIFSCILTICSITVYSYYKENKIWNEGKCDRCGIPWTQTEPPSPRVYKCKCRVVVFLVKVIK